MGTDTVRKPGIALATRYLFQYLGPDQHAQIAHANTGRASSARFLLRHSSVADCRYSDAKWMLEVAVVIFERHRAVPLAEL